MTKEDLAHALVYCVDRTKRAEMNVSFYCAAGCTIENFVISASGAAGVKLIKGKVSPAGKYLVSRGAEIPHFKPSAIIEYPHHWPYDYCYLYNINT